MVPLDEAGQIATEKTDSSPVVSLDIPETRADRGREARPRGSARGDGMSQERRLGTSQTEKNGAMVKLKLCIRLSRSDL